MNPRRKLRNPLCFQWFTLLALGVTSPNTDPALATAATVAAAIPKTTPSPESSQTATVTTEAEVKAPGRATPLKARTLRASNGAPASGASSALSVPVHLLGQPCKLEGAFSETFLRAIHELGPAQIYPATLSAQNLKGGLGQLKKSLATLKKEANLHPELERYTSKLRQRFEMQASVLNALFEAQTNEEPETLRGLASQILGEADQKTFDELLRNDVQRKKGQPLSQASLESLLDLFNESLGPDPETEFHRAIKKLGIQYHCVFDANER